MNTTQSPLTHPSATQYLGPARVLSVMNDRVQLECPDALPWAQMAVHPRYEAVPGDEVLAIGTNSGEYYVIGIIRGFGHTRIESMGDLTLSAPGGKIEILSSEKVSVTAPSIKFVASMMECVAVELIHRSQNFTQWVHDAMHQNLGRLVSMIEDSWHLKSKRISQRAEEDVKVNGRSIHLN